jgi:hypothetical protein
MPDSWNSVRIVQEAMNLLHHGVSEDDVLQKSGLITGAYPVYSPDHDMNSWFVPVTIGDRLAAFFQFLSDGTFLRFSSFQYKPGNFNDCPAAADWLEPKKILKICESQLKIDEKTGDPYLTYDRSPDRIVWGVPVISEAGEKRLLFVINNTVYEPPANNTIG